MTYIDQLFSIDIVKWITSLFIIIFAVVAMLEILNKFFGWVDKPLSWIKRQDNDHSILLASLEEMKALSQRQDNTDKNVSALIDAQIEIMCDRIHQKTRYYINVLHGIPEDEYADFVRYFQAYASIGGNHGAKNKYEYCINHLPILPVEIVIAEEPEEG